MNCHLCYRVCELKVFTTFEYYWCPDCKVEAQDIVCVAHPPSSILSEEARRIGQELARRRGTLFVPDNNVPSPTECADCGVEDGHSYLCPSDPQLSFNFTTQAIDDPLLSPTGFYDRDWSDL